MRIFFHLIGQNNWDTRKLTNSLRAILWAPRHQFWQLAFPHQPQNHSTGAWRKKQGVGAHSSGPRRLWQSRFRAVSPVSHSFCDPGGSDARVSSRSAGDLGSAFGSGRPPGVGKGSPLQHSCLENPMDRGAWWATVLRVAESDVTERLTLWHFQNGFEN